MINELVELKKLVIFREQSLPNSLQNTGRNDMVKKKYYMKQTLQFTQLPSKSLSPAHFRAACINTAHKLSLTSRVNASITFSKISLSSQTQLFNPRDCTDGSKHEAKYLNSIALCGIKVIMLSIHSRRLPQSSSRSRPLVVYWFGNGRKQGFTFERQ